MNERQATTPEVWVSEKQYNAAVEYANDLKRRNAAHVAKIAGLSSALARQRTEIARLKAEATLSKQKRKKTWWRWWGA